MASPHERIQRSIVTIGNALRDLNVTALTAEFLADLEAGLKAHLEYKAKQEAEAARMAELKATWPITEGQAKTFAHHNGIAFEDAMSMGLNRGQFDTFLAEFDHTNCPDKCPIVREQNEAKERELKARIKAATS